MRILPAFGLQSQPNNRSIKSFSLVELLSSQPEPLGISQLLVAGAGVGVALLVSQPTCQAGWLGKVWFGFGFLIPFSFFMALLCPLEVSPCVRKLGRGVLEGGVSFERERKFRAAVVRWGGTLPTS